MGLWFLWKYFNCLSHVCVDHKWLCEKADENRLKVRLFKIKTRQKVIWDSQIVDNLNWKLAFFNQLPNAHEMKWMYFVK